ncbi:uncharacterized protein LOC144576462 isoform X2 [Callithrix jacchus]
MATGLRRTDGPPVTSRRRASGAHTGLPGCHGLRASRNVRRRSSGAQTGLSRRHGDGPAAHRRASSDVTATGVRRTYGPPAMSRRLASRNVRRGYSGAQRWASRDVTEADLGDLTRRCVAEELGCPLRRAEPGHLHLPLHPVCCSLEKGSSEGQNSKVSPTDSRWEQGRYLPRLCRRMSFLTPEASCTPQLVLPFLNDWRFLLPTLHFPSLSITCSVLIRIWRNAVMVSPIYINTLKNYPKENMYLVRHGGSCL